MDPNDSEVTVFATALFFRFSALLVTATHGQNSTYLATAEQSAKFLVGRMGNIETLALGDISAHEYGINIRKGDPSSCDNEVLYGTPMELATLQSLAGLLIEGLLALLPITGDPTINQTVTSAILHPESPIEEGKAPLSGVLAGTCWTREGNIFFLRGLSEAVKMTTLSSDLHNYIRSFIGVQYNAIMTNVRSDHIYGCTWGGDQPTSYNMINQTLSLRLLVDAIDIFNETDVRQGPSPSTIPTAIPEGPPVKVIAGSVAGGVALLVVLLLFACFLRRRKSRISDGTASQLSFNPFYVDPTLEITPFEWDPYQHMAEDEPRPAHWCTKDRTIRNQAVQEKRSENVPSPATSVPNDIGSQPPPLSTPEARVEDEREPYIRVPLGTSFPDAVRMLYQRMWQHQEGVENPPDYHSHSGATEVPQHRRNMEEDLSRE
ncbi:hypothetical protein Moror_10908 [Moniliophthora roreri MCA 2997]|uniref:Glycoside hydrolase family 76 protein n=1 Tax=Moniliophthora roreri (strain MCA 2997) TaxID=1381753 RepID=V2X3Y1_MONRO|nr:hypothetical protein Moror_10908 [Moniliophthora roreri MCA 2997]